VTTLGFVLLTHAKPKQIGRLIGRLNTMFNGPPIVCHHDFGICDLDTHCFPSNVRFVRPHYVTGWAKFSVVLGTVEAIRILYESSTAPDWFAVLSGSDYPVAPASTILADLYMHSGSVDAFLRHQHIDPQRPTSDWQMLCAKRYLRKSIKIPYLNRKLRPSSRTVCLPGWLSKAFLPFSKSFRLYAGGQWFTANRRCAHYILDWHDRNPALARHYHTVQFSEESYFHCILCNNSSLGIANDHWRYMDWGGMGAHPKTLHRNDLSKVLASKCHFARKFDLDLDPFVFDALDEVT
jgi:hypothetical protein